MKNIEERIMRVYEAPTMTVAEFRVEGGFAGSLERLGSGSAYGNSDFDGGLEPVESGFSNSGGIEGLSTGDNYNNLSF